jgi:hypothetical protein
MEFPQPHQDMNTLVKSSSDVQSVDSEKQIRFVSSSLCVFLINFAFNADFH